MKKPTLASCILGAASFLALLGCAQPTLAARLVDVSIVNRSTGERLTPWRHEGKLYVAGTPGERYAIELKSRRGERVLTVLSVDGVNVLTGQTAATLQSGYVIDGWQSYAINGWRKSMDDVAQFVFTAQPDSYAARTGRDLRLLDYYVGFNRWKSAAIVHGVYARYLEGKKSTEGVDLLALKAQCVVWRGPALVDVHVVRQPLHAQRVRRVAAAGAGIYEILERYRASHVLVFELRPARHVQQKIPILQT